MSYKVLVISYISLISSSPNGRTMQSLIQGIPKESISLFCSRGLPDKNICSSVYRVTNGQALKSLLKFKEMGGVVTLTDDNNELGNLEETPRRGKKRAWKYLIRELCWKYGRWNGKKLKEWLVTQNPDCIILMYGDGAAFQNFAVYASKLLNIPLIVYSCENYCFKNYNYIDGKRYSLPFYLYHKMSLKATNELFEKANALIVNSDELGQEFMKKYGVNNIKTVMMASNIDYRFNAKVRSVKETKVAYLGALGEYRIDALISIAEALGKINPELQLDIYGRTLDKNILNKLIECKHIDYKGFVSYETVIEVMQNVSLLIEAINNDKIIERNKKYGFSTKYADSFACGTPFFVYCPKGIVEARFATEHKCAFVATNEMELEELLKVALFDEEKRQKQIETARNITNRYFNNENNITTVNELISECINERNNLIKND